MKPIRLAALAVDDLREARAWYDRQLPGDGQRLVDAVNLTMDDIRERPQRFPVVFNEIRRALVRPFSYAVFFPEASTFIRVIAVVHQHRDPKVWRRRG